MTNSLSNRTGPDLNDLLRSMDNLRSELTVLRIGHAEEVATLRVQHEELAEHSKCTEPT